MTLANSSRQIPESKNWGRNTQYTVITVAEYSAYPILDLSWRDTSSHKECVSKNNYTQFFPRLYPT